MSLTRKQLSIIHSSLRDAEREVIRKVELYGKYEDSLGKGSSLVNLYKVKLADLTLTQKAILREIRELEEATLEPQGMDAVEVPEEIISEW